jgi:DNA invertase Pin-like site-specific DNA recombinase
MLIGYARVSKSDESQVLDLQIDSLMAAGVNSSQIYTDKASGKKNDRDGLSECLRALREGDTLIVWRLDRLGRSLKHLINTVQMLIDRKIAFKVLNGKGSSIDTASAEGKFIFNMFAALAEFEHDLIRERTIAGLMAARARGRAGGRKMALSKEKVLIAQSAMKNRNTSVSDLCKTLNITRATLYKYISPNGELRERGLKATNQK